MTLLVSTFLMSPIFASENVNTVTEWLDQNQCQKDVYLDDAHQLKENAESQIHNFFAEAAKEENQTCLKGSDQTVQEGTNKTNNPILIFVSLSMPKESLKSLYKEAEQQNLPLIVRGLKNNSFKETAEAFRDLEISAQINPNLFEEHEIKVVPTFVAMDKKEPLQIKGNISLSYVQSKFEEES